MTQFKLIEHLLPVRCDTVKILNTRGINAILCIAEHGCKWRGLSEQFGKWYNIYMRADRLTKKDILGTIFL